jgi:hypothetical protein
MAKLRLHLQEIQYGWRSPKALASWHDMRTARQSQAPLPQCQGHMRMSYLCKIERSLLARSHWAVGRTGVLTMAQRDRDRLWCSRRYRRSSYAEAGSRRTGADRASVRRLLQQLRTRGDAAVIHVLRGKPSNRKLSEQAQAKILAILSQDKYKDFGPTQPARSCYTSSRARSLRALARMSSASGCPACSA